LSFTLSLVDFGSPRVAFETFRGRKGRRKGGRNGGEEFCDAASSRLENHKTV
jgi:hypothetical protein